MLVRSGRTSIPVLRRGLAGAGVPVEVASDETPLVREPAVRPLLDALRAVVNLDNDDPDHPDYLDPVAAEGLLLSPLAGLDATDVRALARALRESDKQLAAGRGPLAATLARAAAGGRARRRGACSGDRRRPPCAGASPASPRCCAGRATLLDAGGTVEEVLWALWSGTGWPELAAPPRAARRCRRPGSPTATSTRCARCSRRPREPRSSAGTPASRRSWPPWSRRRSRPTPSPTRASAGRPVRLLTAHRSKGLEWRLVVVAHVQEGGLARPAPPRDAAAGRPHRGRAVRRAGAPARHHHPRAARRGAPAVLRRVHPRPRATGRHRGRPRPTTRGSSRRGSSPSSASTVRHRQGRPPRPLSLAGSGQRAAPHGGRPGDVRPTAARGRRRSGWPGWPRRPDPTAGRWCRPPTPPPGGAPATSATPSSRSAPADEPVELSASALAGLLECPAKWFLEREAGGGAQVQPGAGVRQPGARDRRPGRQGRARSGPGTWSRS